MTRNANGLLLAGVCLFSIGLTFSAHRAKNAGETERELVRISLENVTRRVSQTRLNLQTVREMCDEGALSRCRAFAQLVAADPTVLKNENRAMFNAFAKLLSVDELHVTDGSGTFVRCFPAYYEGHSLAESAQSAAFIPALTNANYAFVQEPQKKGIALGDAAEDNALFQYAGVARRDQPGLVQVGYRAARIAEARRVADVNEIARTTHFGNGARLSIVPTSDTRHPAGSVTRRDAHGKTWHVYANDTMGYRIAIEIPVEESPLANPRAFDVLVVADIILMLIFALFMTGRKHSFRGDFAALREMFGSRFRADGSLGRVLRNPVTIACAALFILAIGVTWILSAAASRRNAERQLATAASDMRASVSDCADNLLFYQGQAIVNHYKKPENMTVETVQQLMARYGLDEMNVVDKRGIVLAGALADVGFDMGSNDNTAKFNCLLAGAQTYSQDFRAPIENPDGEKRKYAGVAFPWPTKGYIQLGFSEKRLKNGIDFWFEDAAIDWHIGERGYFVIADAETGSIKSCGRTDVETGALTFRKGLNLDQIGFDALSAPKDPKEFFTTTLFGERCLCLSFVNCYHRILCAMPLSEVEGGGFRLVLVSAAVLLAVFVLVVFFMTKLTSLVASLREKERAEHERQLKDLTLAKTIQLSSLPMTFPKEGAYALMAKMVTAREVGGDFYDFFTLPSGRVFFLIADVSGKGVPAALFMMRAKAIIRAAAQSGKRFGEAIADANDMLAEKNDAEMFVTAWFGAYDAASGELDYVNAGHNAPLVKRAAGNVEWLRARSGLVLAAMGGMPYRVHHTTLQPGDSIFLYTDGVTEAMNGAGELYGEERLENVLSNSTHDFIASVQENLTAFVGAAEQSDDITYFVLKRKDTAKGEK